MKQPIKNKERKFFKRPTATPTAADAAQAAAAAFKPGEKGKKTFALLRGMHDRLPKEERYWRAATRAAEDLAEYFQFGRIDTPLLEEAGLFVRSLGRSTDVVDKEMYIFDDRDGQKICLRPEATASVARAYIGSGLWNQAQPIKLWYQGPMFRHDRPQSGRYRQFHQVGFETFGVKDPAIDAELILVAFDFFKDLGLNVEVRMNSLGTLEERARYKIELINYYRTKRSYLCEDCRQRLTKNPLRLLDCKEPGCQPVKDEAPQLLDWLGDDSKSHFMKTLEYLDELGVPYLLTPSLVRGLDYYAHTVFEFYLAGVAEESAQMALGAGGRYDGLVEELGGRSAPAAGFAIGLERVVMALHKQNEAEQSPLLKPPAAQVFFAQLGDEARRQALLLINQLRGTGLRLAFNFFKNSLKNQLEAANAVKAKYVLILGQKEVQDKTVIVRDMESGVQEIIDQKKIEAVLKRKLEKN